MHDSWIELARARRITLDEERLMEDTGAGRLYAFHSRGDDRPATVVMLDAPTAPLPPELAKLEEPAQAPRAVRTVPLAVVEPRSPRRDLSFVGHLHLCMVASKKFT